MRAQNPNIEAVKAKVLRSHSALHLFERSASAHSVADQNCSQARGRVILHVTIVNAEYDMLYSVQLILKRACCDIEDEIRRYQAFSPSPSPFFVVLLLSLNCNPQLVKASATPAPAKPIPI